MELLLELLRVLYFCQEISRPDSGKSRVFFKHNARTVRLSTNSNLLIWYVFTDESYELASQLIVSEVEASFTKPRRAWLVKHGAATISRKGESVG